TPGRRREGEREPPPGPASRRSCRPVPQMGEAISPPATKMKRRRSPRGTSVRPFAALPPIERRHARQRIAEERSRQALVLAQLFAAITLSQCQRIRPKTRRERRRRIVGKQFGHFSLPPLTSHAAALGHASTL